MAVRRAAGLSFAVLGVNVTDAPFVPKQIFDGIAISASGAAVAISAYRSDKSVYFG